VAEGNWRPIHPLPTRVNALAIWVVRRIGCAQQQDRATPQTGVAEIRAARSGYYADAWMVRKAVGIPQVDVNWRLPHGDGRKDAGCMAFF
jgi:hypothetical protein